MTLSDWLSEAENRLKAAGVESARLESQVLASHVLLVDRSWLLAHPEVEFPDLAGETLIQRRERHEPLAYIVGKREFYGREFIVRPGVLIPRQDTETLIEATLESLDGRCSLGSMRLLDIGVGSGAIAITLKLECPKLDVSGVDISPVALEVAKENAERLGAEVKLSLSDGFETLGDARFDFIVSNPPYIGQSESLMSEVQDYEPSVALFSGLTGLEFYDRLAMEAPPRLRRGGRLLMEVGHTQAEEVENRYVNLGWRHVRTVNDLSGIQRVVEFERGALVQRLESQM